MSWFRRAYEVFCDAEALGVRFCFQGLRRLVGGGEQRIDIPNVGSALIRRGDSDFASFREVFRDRGYDVGSDFGRRQIGAACKAIVARGSVPVIVDAGANIGAASIWYRVQYPDAHIVAIEPDEQNAKLLRRNLAPFDKTTVLEAAIGSTPGFVSLVRPGQSWAIQTHRGLGETAIVTMADAVASVQHGVLLGAKIDIEGFESDLFSANTEWIDDVAFIAIEPHDWMRPGAGLSCNFQREMAKRQFELVLREHNIIYSRVAPSTAFHDA